MLKLGICDNDGEYAGQLHNMLVKLLFSQTEVEIYHFKDGNEIIDSVKKGDFSLDLLFIDIHREHLNGMKTIDFIRKYGIPVDLFFLAESLKDIPEGYSYHAFAYYKKPVKEELLERDLHIYLKERSSCTDNFSISMKGRDIHLPLNRIIYFKSEKRKITVYTLTASVSFYAKMDEVQHLVEGRGFTRCHQSYIVNRSMIDVVERTEIIAQGIHIPMSRKYYENIEVIEETRILRLTKGSEVNKPKGGTLVFVKGELTGAIIRIRPEQEILLGRDGSRVDIAMVSKKISRMHCGIVYHKDRGEYTVYDYSKNGVLLADERRTQKNQSIRLKAGEEISLGTSENVIRLG